MASLIRPQEQPEAETTSLTEAAEKLYDMLSEQREEVETADSWLTIDPQVKHIKLPGSATPDAKALREKAPTPWLGLAVTVVSQQLFCEGYRTDSDNPEERPNAKGWDAWQMNRMDSRQIPLHRGAVGHGSSFIVTLPGTNRLTKKAMPVMRGYSARSMVASYEDSANDEWPIDAMYVEEDRRADGTIRDGRFFLITDNEVVEMSEDGGKFTVVSLVQKHGIGVPPVVRFCNMLDLDGRVTGEVVPFIPMAARLDQDTFDRLIVQRYGAWRVRWATGLVKPDPKEQAAQSAALRQQDLLVNESTDGKFGTLEPTELKGYIEAREADIRDLAAVTQTPPQYLLGSVSNMSAEALAASEAMLTRKVEERKHSFGESHEQNLRLAAFIMEDEEAAADFNSAMRWRDVESRSLAQVADALGKLSTMMELPWEVLVDRIPGWTDEDTKVARVLKEKAEQQARDDAEALAAAGAAANPPAGGGGKGPTPRDLGTKRPPAA